MRTPKDCALDLLIRHEAIIEQSCNQSSRQAHHNAAKSCAFVSVAEIVYSWASVYGHDETEQPDIKYWLEVKKELEKL